MHKINWKIRFKNPLFIGQIILAILTPILAYVGLSVSDITTWGILFDLIVSAIMNPYILFLVVVSVFNAITDPTTKGIKDSKTAMSYEVPNEEV